MEKPAAGMPIDGGHGENILLIRLKSLGDILFVLPALNLMRDNFPHARITFLVSSEYVPLLRGFAAIDSVIPIDRAIYRRKKIRAIWSTTLELVRRLRREKFTLVVDFQGYGETAWLTWLTGARRRWGFVYRPGSAWAYTRGVKFPEKLHPVHRNLSLPTRCGVSPKPIRNEFLLTEAELRPARWFFQEHGLDPLFDPTNQDTIFFRNRLRHELIPYLESYNPQARQVIWRRGAGENFFIARKE